MSPKSAFQMMSSEMELHRILRFLNHRFRTLARVSYVCHFRPGGNLQVLLMLLINRQFARGIQCAFGSLGTAMRYCLDDARFPELQKPNGRIGLRDPAR